MANLFAGGNSRFLFHDINENVHYELDSLAKTLVNDFISVRDQTLDVLEALSKQIESQALERYLGRIKIDIVPYSIVDSINARIKSAPRVTRDSEEIMKGQMVPVMFNFWPRFHRWLTTRPSSRS